MLVAIFRQPLILRNLICSLTTGLKSSTTDGRDRRPVVVRRMCARLTLLDGDTQNMTELDRHWLERLQVMGKTQSRYLWILLITMIFYGALQERVYVDTDPLKMPIVDVEISGSFVLGFGPALISFFVLAITGTMRATLHGAAEKKSTPRPMHSTWPSTPPRSLQNLSPWSPTSATLHSWLSASMRPLGSRSSYGMLKRRLPAVGFVVYEFLRRVQDVPTLWRTK